MSRMRLRIADRLKEAQNVNAMLTTFNEVDMRSVWNAYLGCVVRVNFMHVRACQNSDGPAVY